MRRAVGRTQPPGPAPRPTAAQPRVDEVCGADGDERVSRGGGFGWTRKCRQRRRGRTGCVVHGQHPSTEAAGARTATWRPVAAVACDVTGFVASSDGEATTSRV